MIQRVIMMNDIRVMYTMDDNNSLIEFELNYRDRHVKINSQDMKLGTYMNFLLELLSSDNYDSMVKVIKKHIPPSAEFTTQRELPEIFHANPDNIVMVGYDPDYMDILKEKQLEMIKRAKQHEADKR
jgi:hypothetical protein